MKLIPEHACWNQFLERWLTNKDEWLFRGDTITNRDDPVRSLRTSFDRALENWGNAIGNPNRKKIESELIRDFQRRFNQSNAIRPSKDDTLTWLALMQHHGAPTRLLDWTYSPFVAAFFAYSELLIRSDSRVAVWAIRRTWFDDLLKTKLGMRTLNDIERIKLNDLKAFDSLFRRKRTNKRFVYPVMPFELNQRLIIQQGVFLCPSDITKTFSENFNEMLQEYKDTDCIRIYVFELSRTDLKNALIDLHRMNVYDASLFPGMDGYAKSFKTRLPIIDRIIKDQERKPSNTP